VIHTLGGIVAVYLLLLWLDGREERRRQRRVERELAELERREREEPRL
jgi:hypothetical protein